MDVVSVNRISHRTNGARNFTSKKKVPGAGVVKGVPLKERNPQLASASGYVCAHLGENVKCVGEICHACLDQVVDNFRTGVVEDEDEHEDEEDEEEDNWSRSTETVAYSPLPVRNEYACPPHTTRHCPNVSPPEEEEDPELD